MLLCTGAAPDAPPPCMCAPAFLLCPPAVKQDLLLAFVDCVDRNGAKLARQRLQLEVLPSLLPPAGGGGMPGSIIDVPALPQPVDVTAAPAPPSPEGVPPASNNVVPAAAGGGSSSSGSKEGGGAGGSSKGVTVTVASSQGSTAQQELAAQAAAATAAAVLENPAALNRIAAAISPDDILHSVPQQGGSVIASFDDINPPAI